MPEALPNEVIVVRGGVKEHDTLNTSARYERVALRWLQRFIDERLPPLTEVALAASALAELRHGRRNAGVETLKPLLRSE